MYLGHFAAGLAAKPVARKVPLGVLLVATQAIDILYGVFLFIGVNRTGGAGVWDHGLVMSLVWSAAAFAVAYLFYRDFRSGLIVGLLVFSHWIADLIAWDHVLPLAFADEPRVGFGLYNSLAGMIVGDFGLLLWGLRFTSGAPRLRTGSADGPLGCWSPISWL